MSSPLPALDLEALIEHLRQGAGKFAALETRMTNVESSINKLTKILTDGNGQPSVISQLSAIQTHMKTISLHMQKDETEHKELDTKISKFNAESVSQAGQDRRMGRQSKIMIITCVITSITGIVITLLSLYFKK